MHIEPVGTKGTAKWNVTWLGKTAGRVQSSAPDQCKTFATFLSSENGRRYRRLADHIVRYYRILIGVVPLGRINSCILDLPETVITEWSPERDASDPLERTLPLGQAITAAQE